MTYRLNGVDLALQPETAHWNSRESFGMDGGGHPVYPRNRTFEMRWGFMSMSEFNQLMSFYSPTGTVVATLPRWNSTPYAFYDYTGCTMAEPEVGDFFEEYVSEVRLVIMRVPTG